MNGGDDSASVIIVRYRLDDLSSSTQWIPLTARHQSRFSVSISHSDLQPQYTSLHNSAVKYKKHPMPLPTMLLLYQFLADQNLYMRRDAGLQIALPTTLTLLFFCTFGILHLRYIHAIFELQGRPFCLSFFVSSHSFIVTFHLSFTQRHLWWCNG